MGTKNWGYLIEFELIGAGVPVDVIPARNLKESRRVCQVFASDDQEGPWFKHAGIRKNCNYESQMVIEPRHFAFLVVDEASVRNRKGFRGNTGDGLEVTLSACDDYL